MLRALRLLAVLCVAITAAGCSSAFAPAAAVVDGHKIPESLVEEEIDFLRDDPTYLSGLAQDGEAYRGVERRSILGSLIRMALVERELSRRGADVTDGEVDSLIDRLAVSYGGRERLFQLVERQNLTPARFRTLAVRQARVEKIQRLLTEDARPSQEVVSRLYEERLELFEQVRLSRITVDEGDEAEEIAESLAEGASFATLARERSQDGAASEGGEVGWVDVRLLDDRTRTELDGVGDGGIAGPVPVPGGFQVIQVHERRTAPLEEVSDEITDTILARQRQEAFDGFLRAEVARVSVVVNPKYGRFDPERFAVVGDPDGLPE